MRRPLRRRRRRCGDPCARRRSTCGEVQMNAEIIITGKGHAGTMAILEKDFTCHKLFEAKDQDAFLKQHSATVRGLATFGPLRIDGKLMDKLPKLEIISNFGVGVD